jgi:uncharacterized protein (TIGR02271 family)
MESIQTYDSPDATADLERTTLAAAFGDREQAHEAIHRLHDEGFRETWLGITRSDDTSPSTTSAALAAGETRVEADNWFNRFFGEGDESLYDALVRRGVAEADARGVGSLAPHSAILTVYGENHPELAAQIIAENGGRLITRGFNAAGFGPTGTFAAARAASTAPMSSTFASGADFAALGSADEPAYDEPVNAERAYAVPVNGEGAYAVPVNAERAYAVPVTGERAYAVPVNAERAYAETAESGTPASTYASEVPLPAAYASDVPSPAADAAAAPDYGKYRGGTAVDDDTRLQLREERLRIDKERRSRGEATISKDVVTQAHEVDVPLIREELFIERRPANGTAASAPGAIADESDVVVRIPLTEEQLSVTKTPVVTEEVVIGKREVHAMSHVSETTRKEELNVKDVDVPGDVRQAPSEPSTQRDTRLVLDLD